MYMYMYAVDVYMYAVDVHVGWETSTCIYIVYFHKHYWSDHATMFNPAHHFKVYFCFFYFLQTSLGKKLLQSDVYGYHDDR